MDCPLPRLNLNPKLGLVPEYLININPTPSNTITVHPNPCQEVKSCKFVSNQVFRLSRPLVFLFPLFLFVIFTFCTFHCLRCVGYQKQIVFVALRSLPEITAVIEFGRQIKEITGGASLERLTPKSDQEIPKGKNIQSGKPYPNVRLGNTKRKNIQSDIQPRSNPSKLIN